MRWLGLVIVAGITTAQSARDPSPPGTPKPSRAAAQEADHSTLAGSWRLDEIQSKLSAENWRNRQIDRSTPPAPCLPTLTRPGEPETYDCGPAMPTSNTYNPRGVEVLNAFGPDLLEASPTLTIQIGASSVSIGGELRETTTYTTDGQKQKIRVFVRHAPPVPPPNGRKAAPPLSEDVTVKTHWSGASLVQEMTGERFGTAFAMTETLLPADDVQQLFVMIDVRAPKLKPEIKPIRRVYVRGAGGEPVDSWRSRLALTATSGSRQKRPAPASIA